MDEREGFLRAILDDPDDDTPRLVYADWLEERGDPRAEFIRIQCEYDPMPPMDPRRGPLERRASELLRLHEGEWVGPELRLARYRRFRRGFVEEIIVESPSCEGFFELGPIQSLTITIQDLSGLRTLLDSRIAGRLRQLILNGSHLGDEGAEAIAASPALAGLSMLRLDRCEIRTTGARALASSPHLANLTFLGLSHNCPPRPGDRRPRPRLVERAVGDPFAFALSESAFLGRLETLHVAGCDLGDLGARALVGSPRLPRLRSLLLSGNPLSEGVFRDHLPRAGLKVYYEVPRNPRR